MNKRHKTPLIGLELPAQAQCALASVNNVESIGLLLQNIVKYSDYVVIISVHSLHDISSTANMPLEFISNA